MKLRSGYKSEGYSAKMLKVYRKDRCKKDNSIFRKDLYKKTNRMCMCKMHKDVVERKKVEVREYVTKRSMLGGDFIYHFVRY